MELELIHLELSGIGIDKKVYHINGPLDSIIVIIITIINIIAF